MALTAHTFVAKRRFPAIKGGYRSGIMIFTPGAVYTTNGFDITAANLGLNRIFGFIPPAHVAGATALCVTEVTYTSDTAIKLKMRTIAAGVELTNNSDDYDSIPIRCFYWGS